MRLREITPTQSNAPPNADAQRVKQLKSNAERAEKTAQIAQQQLTAKKANEKLAKLRQS